MASLCRSAAAAGIKYSDTGAVPEGLIELLALPDEITGGAAGTADEKVSTLGASMFKSKIVSLKLTLSRKFPMYEMYDESYISSF